MPLATVPVNIAPPNETMGAIAPWIPVNVAPPTAGAADLPRTILYIEDNQSNLTLVESVLARYPDVTVFAAVRGGVGLEMADRYRPEMILLDLHLPDIPGEEVLRQLRLNPATSHIPVVVVSADAIPERAKALLAAGACGYIKKPLEIVPFLKMLRECHSAKDASPSSQTAAVF